MNAISWCWLGVVLVLATACGGSATSSNTAAPVTAHGDGSHAEVRQEASSTGGSSTAEVEANAALSAPTGNASAGGGQSDDDDDDDDDDDGGDGAD